MPKTIFRATYTGADHNTYNASNPATLYQGLQGLRAGTYRVTEAKLTASKVGHATASTTESVQPSVNGVGSDWQDVFLWHYTIQSSSVELDIAISSVQNLLTGGGVTLGLGTSGDFYLREFGGCIWELTITWEYTYTACTAPSSVTLNTANKVLTITGGAGGTANAKVGYGLEYRQSTDGGSTWGAWTSLGTVGTRTNLTIDAGACRQYRARTEGEAGASYYSGYTYCATTLVGNTAPGTPTISRPASGATAKTTTPRVRVTVPAEPDGQNQTLQRKVDSGSWANVTTVSGAGGTVVDLLPTLATGSHTIYYQLVDTQNAVGSTASVSITVAVPTWTRVLAVGAVISNASISHRTDLTELLAAINACRAYYGLAAVTMTGTLGKWGDWQSQVQQMQSALGACYTTLGLSAPSWSSIPGGPNVSGAVAALNELRGAMI